MNQEVAALSKALDAVRDKLIATARTSPGFGEMRALYRELTDALVVAGDKAEAVLRKEIEEASKRITEEWESNKENLSAWLDVLKPVVAAVDVVLRSGSLTNPLLALLP